MISELSELRFLNMKWLCELCLWTDVNRLVLQTDSLNSKKYNWSLIATPNTPSWLKQSRTVYWGVFLWGAAVVQGWRSLRPRLCYRGCPLPRSGPPPMMRPGMKSWTLPETNYPGHWVPAYWGSNIAPLSGKSSGSSEVKEIRKSKAGNLCFCLVFYLLHVRGMGHKQ
jgi:hypothetical protein